MPTVTLPARKPSLYERIVVAAAKAWVAFLLVGVLVNGLVGQWHDAIHLAGSASASWCIVFYLYVPLNQARWAAARYLDAAVYAAGMIPPSIYRAAADPPLTEDTDG